MTMHRSAGKTVVARSLWYTKPGTVELRAAPLRPPQPGEARVRTLFSGISRGTERLVLDGNIGMSEWQRMPAPLQEGSFPFPVKYGYCATGIVEAGPDELMGRAVFCLHPHQDYFLAPSTMLIPLPDDIPPRRATLTANMETALNAHWDAGTGPGDKIVIVGSGAVGTLIAAIATRMPGTDVTVVDVAPARKAITAALGARFSLPENAPSEADVVFHTSATASGLATAIAAAGIEAAVVELSWYGGQDVSAPLGGAFHSRRLRLISSQVGQVAPSHRPRWTHQRRMDAALKLLADPMFDMLVEEEISFAEAPRLLPDILRQSSERFAPVIRYP